MTSKKILHIIPGFGGGISSFTKNLACGSKGSNVINDVIGFSDYPDEYKRIFKEQEGECYKLPNIYKSPLRFLRTYFYVLKKNQYYAVHCHISGFKGFVFKIFARMAGVLNIYTHAHRTSDEYKGCFYNINQCITRFFSKCISTKLFCCSQMAANFIYGKYNNALFLPNSIDISKWDCNLRYKYNAIYRNELNINNDAIVVGHIGRFNKQKNHRFIVDLISKIILEDKKYVFIFCGDGDLKSDIYHYAKQNKVLDNIRFVGFRDDINQLSLCFDLFILPSLYEGLPTVAVEMQAIGIPIFLANTITQEVDLGLGLVQYLSLDISDWVSRILNNKVLPISDRSFIIKTIIEKGFTVNELAKKYSNLI